MTPEDFLTQLRAFYAMNDATEIAAWFIGGMQRRLR